MRHGSINEYREPIKVVRALRNDFRIETLIAAYHYTECAVYDGQYDRGEGKEWLLKGQTFPRSFLQSLEAYLVALAGWSMGDNKVVFVFTCEGEINALSLYDAKATLITWRRPYNATEAVTVPANIHRNAESVAKAIETWIALDSYEDTKAWRESFEKEVLTLPLERLKHLAYNSESSEVRVIAGNAHWKRTNKEEK
jgi:hypothetical protein